MVCPPATSEAGILSDKVVSCSNINGYLRNYQDCLTLSGGENCEAISDGACWSEFIILRIPMPCHDRKVAVLALFGYRRQHFFFSRKLIFLYTTLIQLPMAVIKIKISIFFDRVPHSLSYLPSMGPVTK
jgi:hypothetical protein